VDQILYSADLDDNYFYEETISQIGSRINPCFITPIRMSAMIIMDMDDKRR
jgi:hypothetical protein